MTLALLSHQPIVLPGWEIGRTPASFVDEVILDNQDEKYVLVFRAPKTGNISQVGWRNGAKTTDGDVDVRIETVSLTTGDPTGTLKAVNANGTETVNAANTWHNTVLTSACAVTVGDLIAVVLNVLDMNPSTDAVFGVSGFSADAPALPYVLENTGAGFVAGVRAPAIALKYDDGAYYGIPFSSPFSSLSSSIIQNGTTPDEVGLRLQYPVPLRVVGVWSYTDLDGNCDFVLYDSGDTALATLSTDKDVRILVSAGWRLEHFSSPQTLAADTTYRLTMKPTEAVNCRVWFADVDNNAVLAALPGANLQTYWTQRTDAGAFADTTTRIPYMGLLVDQFDDGAGGGGGSCHVIGG